MEHPLIRALDFVLEPRSIEGVVSVGIVSLHRIGLGNGRQRPGHRMFAVSLSHLSMAADTRAVADIAHVGLNISKPGFESQAAVVVVHRARGTKGYFGSRPSTSENRNADQNDNAQPLTHYPYFLVDAVENLAIAEAAGSRLAESR